MTEETPSHAQCTDSDDGETNKKEVEEASVSCIESGMFLLHEHWYKCT